MHFQIVKTDSTHPDFVSLVRLLDAELAARDGNEHGFYAQFNSIAALNYVVVAYDSNEVAVGCGAIKPITENAMEVKRMYTATEARGKKVASAVLQALEEWAAALGYQQCLLETGKRQPEAIGLYQKMGYQQIDNYGQYAGVDNSVCFQKLLTHV